MATKLTKNVSREINITDANGVTGPVILTLTPTGLELRGKGKQRTLTFKYSDIRPTLPANAPAKYSTNPLGWLVEGAADKADKPTPATDCTTV